MPDTWIEYRRLVLAELERLSEQLEGAVKNINEIQLRIEALKQETTDREVISEKDLLTLKSEMHSIEDKMACRETRYYDKFGKQIEELKCQMEELNGSVLVHKKCVEDRLSKPELFMHIIGDPKVLLKTIEDLNRYVLEVKLKSGLWGALGASLPVVAGVVTILLSKP